MDYLYFDTHRITWPFATLIIQLDDPDSLTDPFKVAATSLKLEIRLHAHQVGTNTRSGTEVIF